MASETYPWDSFRQSRDIDSSLCFVLSPFHKDFAGTKQMIDDVAREFSLRCERADDIQKSGTIHADIWAYIQRAAVIVADLTTSNPNVMLELGVATAVKEQFRVILLIRQEGVATVPFDLSPFRHIQYENTLAGATALRNQLREYFRLALSEDATIASLSARMEKWEKSEHNYALLVQPETLPHLRAGSKTPDFSVNLLAFLLAASIQHGMDLEWWARINHANVKGAEAAVELLLGPWARPQFRAAYVLQHLNADIKGRAISEARRLSVLPLVGRLLDAAEHGNVVQFTASESSGLITESERYELLQNFTPRVTVRLNPG
jgi:hypothetical protein